MLSQTPFIAKGLCTSADETGARLQPSCRSLSLAGLGPVVVEGTIGSFAQRWANDPIVPFLFERRGDTGNAVTDDDGNEQENKTKTFRLPTEGMTSA